MAKVSSDWVETAGSRKGDIVATLTTDSFVLVVSNCWPIYQKQWSMLCKELKIRVRPLPDCDSLEDAKTAALDVIGETVRAIVESYGSVL